MEAVMKLKNYPALREFRRTSLYNRWLDENSRERFSENSREKISERWMNPQLKETFRKSDDRNKELILSALNKMILYGEKALTQDACDYVQTRYVGGLAKLKEFQDFVGKVQQKDLEGQYRATA